MKQPRNKTEDDQRASNKKVLSLILMGILVVASIFVPVQQVFANTKPSSVQKTTDIKTMVSQMSTRDKITQMLMPDFRNWNVNGKEQGVTSLNPDIRAALKKYKFGGVILFAENVVETKQTAKLTHDFQATMINSGNLPLLLSIDQEGGTVRRLGTGTSLPGNMALGASKSTQDAYNAGKITGDELASLGINTNFAPSIDVNNNPKNPVIGLRSFSSDPQLVSNLGMNFIKGIQDQGEVSAAKHFPGHGDTDTDSHIGLPVVNKSLAELNQTELVPFRAAAKSGVDMFMTAHIQYPQIEKETFPSKIDGKPVNLPATMSPKILTDLVRKDMGYQGVIVTDALGMQAIADNFGESDACIQAIKAGADILLMPTTLRSNQDLAKLDKIIADIEAAVKSGKIPEKRLNDSVTRILTLKQKRGILDLKDNLLTEDQQVKLAEQHVGSAANRAAERAMSLDAMTVLNNKANVLPLKPKKKEKVLFVTAAENQVPGTKFSIARLQNEGLLSKDFTVDTTSFGSNSKGSDYNSQVDQADYVVVYTNMVSENSLSNGNFAHDVPQAIFDYAKSKGKKTIQVSTNKPYDGTNFKNADATVLTYGYLGMDPTEGGKEPTTTFGPNIPAAVELIFGRTPNNQGPKGTLPVDLPKIENGVMSTTEYTHRVGYSASDWLNLPELGVTAKRATVEPGQKMNLRLTLPQSSLDINKTHITLNLNNNAFKFSKNNTQQLTTDFKDNKEISVTVAKDATNQVITNLFSTATITDQYGRVFKIQKISGPNFQVKVTVNKQHLQNLVDHGNRLVASNYTGKSWAAYSDELNKAQQILNDTSATQKEVDQQFISLQKQEEKLVKAANKNKLQRLVDHSLKYQAENYTPKSWNKYSKVLEKSQQVLGDTNVKQKKVDKQIEKLQTAQNGLTRRANKNKLQRLVDRSQKYQESDYTAKSWEKYHSRLVKAQDVLKNQDASQKKVDKQVEKLQKAQEQLTRVK